MFVARIVITLKRTVNDPQGQTIRGGLLALGFGSVEGVRAGKYMEVYLREGSREAAARRVADMCGRLLANPVIEEYRFELEHVPDP